MTINKRLKELVYALNINATELATRLDVTKSTISNTLNANSLPSSKVLIPLGEVFNVNINWLFQKMNIIIDTSILRKDRGFIHSDILLLKKMSKLGLLKIHIPWIVYKEATSQNFIELKNIFNKTINELSSLNRKGIFERDYTDLQRIVGQLENIKSKISTSVDKHWGNFISESKAILHEIDGEHGKRVMASYFLGEGSFSEPKSRKDIPDAFIFEGIKTISKTYGDIHFICDDKNLRKSVNDESNCYAYESYSRFYDSQAYKKIEIEYKKIEHFSDELISLKENVDLIIEFATLEIYGDLFAGHDQLIVHKNIPGNEGLLQTMDNVSVENVYLDKIQFVDEIFYIPIDLTASFGIEYFIPSSVNYYLYEKERKISMIDRDDNLVKESFQVKLSYKCSIKQKNIKDKKYIFNSEFVAIKELEVMLK